MSSAARSRFRARRRTGASVIGKLDALMQHALDGRAIVLADDVTDPLRRICADRIARLADEPADVVAIVEIIAAEAEVASPGVLVSLAQDLMAGSYPPFFHSFLEMLVGALSPERQSSIFALAASAWAIAEAKAGPVNVKSDYTPGIDRVTGSVGLLITSDFADRAQLAGLIASALRNNPQLWQITGRRRREWTGE